jgi:hypothetical protein
MITMCFIGLVVAIAMAVGVAVGLAVTPGVGLAVGVDAGLALDSGVALADAALGAGETLAIALGDGDFPGVALLELGGGDVAIGCGPAPTVAPPWQPTRASVYKKKKAHARFSVAERYPMT